MQYVGTVWFNVMTLRAVVEVVGGPDAARSVWRPDVFGSICFLVSSAACWSEVRAGRSGPGGRDLTWWVVSLNVAGSVVFGASSVGSTVRPVTGDPVSALLGDGGTFVGAIHFLVGAALLVPEARNTPEQR